MNAPISFTELEQAINYWRAREPSQGEESRLCPKVAALATPYALMIIGHRREISPDQLEPAAQTAYQAWRSASETPSCQGGPTNTQTSNAEA